MLEFIVGLSIFTKIVLAVLIVYHSYFGIYIILGAIKGMGCTFSIPNKVCWLLLVLHLYAITALLS